MRPLEGLTVLDLTRLLPGPFCAWLLRSWGARVVKVEEPKAGDYLREMRPVWFAHLNAGAESIAVDLKRPAGRELLLRLAPAVDIILEGFRPGVMERLGLGYDALRQANPRLVLVSISGFGSDGPLVGRAGHDITYLARGGLLSLMNELPPIQIADLGAGLTAAAGALAAVVQALRTGSGVHVGASLQDAVFGLGSLQAVEARAGMPPQRDQMMLAGALPAYSVYTTRDGGRVALGALEFKFWQHFCTAVERPDLMDRHMDWAVRPDLEELFASRTRSEWAELADRADTCLEPVLTMSEAVAEREHLQPVRFGGDQPEAAGPAPSKGAHTWNFLREHGFTEQELTAAAAEAIISGP